jgi:adenylate kinase family enzyme
MKIAIIGNAGSGKSNLGHKLHEKLGLPLYHLDQYFWGPGWQHPDYAEYTKIHHALCDRDEWIIEGMNTRIIDYRAQKADIVIFLDLPTYLCLYRIFKRAITNWGNVYFSSTPGCPERGPDLKFLKYIWNFNNIQKPRIGGVLATYKNTKKIFVIKNQKELNKLINKLGK